MTKQFRKKPVVIEAVRLENIQIAPEFAQAICTSGYRSCDYNHEPHIHTLEGVMKIAPEDWIIKGVKGEFYPCKPDIFAATYEPAESVAASQPSGEQTQARSKRLTKKQARAARRREKRAILAQMPYRDAAEWAASMVTVREVPLGPIKTNEWQVIFCGYEFPAKKDKAAVDRHADDLRRVLRKKFRHYGAQEKRALCAVFGQRQKEGRDILRPEIQGSPSHPSGSAGARVEVVELSPPNAPDTYSVRLNGREIISFEYGHEAHSVAGNLRMALSLKPGGRAGSAAEANGPELCKCGHNKAWHRFGGKTGCSYFSKTLSIQCECIKFEPAEPAVVSASPEPTCVICHRTEGLHGAWIDGPPHEFAAAQPVADDPKVEEAVQQIVNLELQRHLYATSNWREEYPKLLAAILAPYFTQVSQPHTLPVNPKIIGLARDFLISTGQFTPFDPNATYAVTGQQIVHLINQFVAQLQIADRVVAPVSGNGTESPDAQ